MYGASDGGLRGCKACISSMLFVDRGRALVYYLLIYYLY
jgi:hypothetical protein